MSIVPATRSSVAFSGSVAMPGRRALAAARALRRGGIAHERAVGDDVDLRQQLGEAAHGGRLGGAAGPAHEQPADGGVDRVEQQRALQALLLDDGREREAGQPGSTDHPWMPRRRGSSQGRSAAHPCGEPPGSRPIIPGEGPRRRGAAEIGGFGLR
jgi:hypothetical protein